MRTGIALEVRLLRSSHNTYRNCRIRQRYGRFEKRIVEGIPVIGTISEPVDVSLNARAAQSTALK